jgi:hypothetical protein
MTAWTVRDRDGRLIADLTASSPVEVGRRIVPARYDAFRLVVSSSYREMFDRAVAQVLEREGWQIVRVKAGSARKCTADRGMRAAAA